ncbi:MAG: hypothetical protein PHO04_02555 [Candidatus Pacebacteria bacterium]|jgi:hypothetical protein|nr:hypothetical protein [Candidatus Paceibacterota bacterium]MDD2796772.1 hypothetical protein [Candidatus Paceibacterota bacterium]MDD3048240.1 hypothetical protein [Candidatus Paceibacterota bacterium]MDD3510146.1 hypothetical protein [Candidatus Paceibacterota bacterium]MDD3918807.1 hypothetical protein [Candidatus Paceibacterota bacterium]
MIENELKSLDFEPTLKIMPINIPFLRRRVILSDENGTNYVKNPKVYLVNGKEGSELAAVMLASRAIRRRAQIVLDVEKFEEENFGFLFLLVEGNAELDAELVARMSGNLFLKGVSLEERKQFLLMNASEIISDYGEKFLLDSVWIQSLLI